MYMLNMVIILIVMYCNVVTAIDKIPTYLLRFNTTWHELLRSFIKVKELYIDYRFMEEFSCALQLDELGSDPEFLPNLLSTSAARNLFTSFIDTHQVVGRPVQFEEYSPGFDH